MAEASIPVDLLNPGQVFACLGFVEAADILLGEAEGSFDWSQPGAVQFRIRAKGSESPISEVLAFLEKAKVRAEVVRESDNVDNWNKKWGELRTIDPMNGYPFPDPESPATLVAVFEADGKEIHLDHWGDVTRDNVKFWAGAGGYPGAALARDALDLLRENAVENAHDPFSFATPQSSSFRLDWRRDYIPLDAGFSLNAHSHISTQGFPIVEVLAAIGLTHARPFRPFQYDKLDYRYGVAGRDERSGELWLPPSFLRAALGLAELPFPMRRFRMLLDWPGQENQARAITIVTEEEE